MKLEFSPRARLDLFSILHSISADKPQAATRFVANLERHCDLLARFPHLVGLREDLLPDLRVFAFRGYGIYYRVLVDTVRIDRVLSPGLDVNLDSF